MDGHGCVVVVVADGAPAVIVEFLKGALVKFWPHGLIQELDSSDHIGGTGVTGCEIL